MMMNTLEPQTMLLVRPQWANEIHTFHLGRIARQFILHFNINDLVIDTNDKQESSNGEYKRKGEVVGNFSLPPTLREYLHEFLFSELKCQGIYTYSLAGGLIADDSGRNGIGAPLGQELRGPTMQRLFDATERLRLNSAKQKRGGNPAEGQEVNLPDNMAGTFKLLGHILRQSYDERGEVIPPDVMERLLSGQQFSSPNDPKETPIAVILDYAEKLVPYHLGEGQGEREQLQALEVVQRWALDPLIRKTKNVIILLTTNIGLIPPSVFAEGSGCRAIRVPLPDEGERSAFIQFLMTRARQKLTPLAPNGLLLAGPPGTGKTIIAEALALESGFNLVKMRNIQDKWIGSSERNLDLVINLLKDLHPVIVFVDEIDQAMVRRDTGQSGDSGVGARMFARILEEMSNAENRGNILWVAATNRADLIDAALLRRFDRVIPLLTPDVHESCRIFAAMLNTISKQSGGNIQVEYGGDLQQSCHKDEQGRPEPTPDDLEKFLPVAEKTAEIGITGAGIEIIWRRGIEMAFECMLDTQPMQSSSMPLVELQHLLRAFDDFKPNYDRLTYDYQSLLALRACNFYSVIPPLPTSGIYADIRNGDGRIDSQKLEAAIWSIEHPDAR